MTTVNLKFVSPERIKKINIISWCHILQIMFFLLYIFNIKKLGTYLHKKVIVYCD